MINNLTLINRRFNDPNNIKNINKTIDTVQTLSNVNYSGSNSIISKGMVVVSQQSSTKSSWNRIVNFDFQDSETQGSVDVYGGKIRIHGKRIIDVPSKTIQITGGTDLTPSWVYVKVVLVSWSASIEYSLTEPTSNNNEINIPLHCFKSELIDGDYVYEYISTSYMGDIQFTNIIAD